MPARLTRLGYLLLGIAAGPVLDGSASARDATAPATKIAPVTDTYHGVTVTDPYRWLEDTDAPDVQAWSAAQNARTRAWLDKLPEHATIQAKLMSLVTQASPSWRDLTVQGGKLFARITQPPKQQPMIGILADAGRTTASRIVVDPNAIDPSGQTAIDWFVPSPDGSKVAVSLSKNGSEDGSVHVFDVATGHELGDVVPRAQFPTGGGSLAWSADNAGFYVTRYPGSERPEADRHFYQQVYYHKLGTDPATDRYVVGRDFPKIAEIVLDNRQNPDLVLVSVENGDGGQFAQYVIGKDGNALRISDFTDQVVAGSIGWDGIYLVSRKDAPRGKLLKLPLNDFRLEDAKTIVPEGDGAIEGGGEFGGEPIVVTKKALYLRELVGGPTRVSVYDHDGGKLGAIALPDPANVDTITPLGDGTLLYDVETYTQPLRILRYDEAKAVSTPTALAATSPVSFADAVVERKFATSKDGTKVPVTIVHRRDARTDGSHPALLYGYGGYSISLTPQFLGPTVRVWLDAGGVYAIANIRGGGEYGDAWHTAGSLTHKQHVFDDFIAAAHLLVDDRFTSPAHLAIMGGSNGGLLMGAALTQAPQLFRAVVALVGIYDMTRIELDPNGAFNVTEFGSVKDLDQFRAMLAYSPYQHVRDGVKYPAVFMATGTHDGRVNPAQSRKMIARLQAATASGHPVYLSISDKAGHGIGSSLGVRVAQQADVMSFLFDQLGMRLP